MVCPFENQPAELIFLVDVRRAGLGSPAGLVLTFSRNCILEQVKARRTGSALLPCWHPKCNNGKLLSSNFNLRQVFQPSKNLEWFNWKYCRKECGSCDLANKCFGGNHFQSRAGTFPSHQCNDIVANFSPSRQKWTYVAHTAEALPANSHLLVACGPKRVINLPELTQS